jgi:hypothetical protein
LLKIAGGLIWKVRRKGVERISKGLPRIFLKLRNPLVKKSTEMALIIRK